MIAKKQSLLVAAAFGVLAALALASAGPARAANTIRILVNDQPITSYDIDQRTKMLRVFTGGKSGQKEATDQLIDEKLMLQEAARRRIEVTDAELDQEITTRASATKMTAAQFEQAMRQAGFDPKTFRQFLRANLSWQRIVRARFRATINVTDQDVTAALSSRDTTGPQESATEYMIQQILFLVPEGANDRTASAQLSTANAFRDAFQGCDNAVAQASTTPNVVVKPPARREESSLPAPLRTTLADLDVGGTTKPERVKEGFQVLAICAKNAIAGQTEAAVAVRDEISGERGQLLARRYLRDLRSDAVIEYR